MRRRCVGVVIPAAGLGTRVREAAGDGAKEMIDVGGRPLVDGARLEAQAAGLEPVFVTADRKRNLNRWLHARGLRTVEQPAPRGSLDAVERGGAALPDGAYAVLYPDYIQLPEQRGLAALVQGWAAMGGDSAYGLVRGNADRAARLGRTVRVETVEWGGGRHRITRVLPAARPEPGTLHCTFAEIRGPAFQAAVANAGDDAALLPALERLVAAEDLFGVELPGEILDLGRMEGVRHARAAFAAARGGWREEDT
jgi:UTP-glucose-1-phosphate uridylyltransferase